MIMINTYQNYVAVWIFTVCEETIVAKWDEMSNDNTACVSLKRWYQTWFVFLLFFPSVLLCTLNSQFNFVLLCPVDPEVKLKMLSFYFLLWFLQYLHSAQSHIITESIVFRVFFFFKKRSVIIREKTTTCSFMFAAECENSNDFRHSQVYFNNVTI